MEQRVENIVSFSGVVSGGGIELLSDMTGVVGGSLIVILDEIFGEIATLKIRFGLKPHLRYYLLYQSCLLIVSN